MKITINSEKIKEFIEKEGWTKKEFCRKCKISLSTLYKIFNEDCEIRIIALFKIAKVLKVQICDLFYDS